MYIAFVRNNSIPREFETWSEKPVIVRISHVSYKIFVMSSSLYEFNADLSYFICLNEWDMIISHYCLEKWFFCVMNLVNSLTIYFHNHETSTWFESLFIVSDSLSLWWCAVLYLFQFSHLVFRFQKKLGHNPRGCCLISNYM